MATFLQICAGSTFDIFCKCDDLKFIYEVKSAYDWRQRHGLYQLCIKQQIIAFKWRESGHKSSYFRRAEKERTSLVVEQYRHDG